MAVMSEEEAGQRKGFQQMCRELLCGKIDYIFTVKGRYQIMAACICIKKRGGLKVDSDS